MAQHISDRKFASEMRLTEEQARKLIKALDLPFFSVGKGDSMVYMFDPVQMDQKISELKRKKKDRRAGS
ncbi:hypothetical protein GF324_09975 [bacterium]|nr:hypothetical protein [bacterium]